MDKRAKTDFTDNCSSSSSSDSSSSADNSSDDSDSSSSSSNDLEERFLLAVKRRLEENTKCRSESSFSRNKSDICEKKGRSFLSVVKRKLEEKGICKTKSRFSENKVYSSNDKASKKNAKPAFKPLNHEPGDLRYKIVHERNKKKLLNCQKK